MSDQFGPSGGTGGNPFTAEPPEGGGWKISAIDVWSGDRIDSIELIWSHSGGETKSSPKFGGSGGNESEFQIDVGDYLTRIEGSVGSKEDNVRIFSLQFFTRNGNMSKIFGKPTQAKFRYDEIQGQQIIGLFGRTGAAIDALGVVYDEIG
jgi:hypothetical protein